jgi:hypothetical protein
MGAADKIFEKNKALVQPHVPEPIRAVAVFQRKGSFGSQLWGAAGVRGMQIAEWEAGKRRAPDFPGQSFLAVTDTALYAFEAKGGFTWKVKDQLGAWPLGSFRSERVDGSVTCALKLDFGDGEGQELETMTSMANARNVEVVDLLCAAPQPDETAS